MKVIEPIPIWTCPICRRDDQGVVAIGNGRGLEETDVHGETTRFDNG